MENKQTHSHARVRAHTHSLSLSHKQIFTHTMSDLQCGCEAPNF